MGDDDWAALRVRRAIARIRNQVALGAMSVFACCLLPLPSMKDSRFISIQARARLARMRSAATQSMVQPVLGRLRIPGLMVPEVGRVGRHRALHRRGEVKPQHREPCVDASRLYARISGWGREHRIGIEAVPGGREQERDQVEPGCTEQRQVQSQIHTRPPRPMRMLSSRRSRCVTAPPAQRVNDSRASAAT
jgi:hypothetical protein